jgi:hypothetical protein
MLGGEEDIIPLDPSLDAPGVNQGSVHSGWANDIIMTGECTTYGKSVKLWLPDVAQPARLAFWAKSLSSK